MSLAIIAASASASSGGAGFGAWLALWIASVLIGLLLYSRSPKLPGMDTKTTQARSAMLVVSLLPCFGLNLIWVFMAYGRYKFGARGMGPNSALNERFKGASFDERPPSQPTRPTQSSGNPFSHGPSPSAEVERDAAPRQPPTSTPSSDNPFL
jgi:hypothetical protein